MKDIHLEDLPFVSIIIPIRNEEKFLGRLFSSIEAQDYPKERLEIIFVDGMSTDKTREKLRVASCEFKILENPKINQCAGMNIGISESKGEIIIRMDAHAEYSSDYVSKCVEVLNKTGTGNAGGHAIPKPSGNGFIANSIFLAHLSPFGLGGARFRNPEKEGFVETVWAGAFKREVFLRVGYFNERLPRTEDIDFNRRIRDAGYKIYLSKEIKCGYYVRETLRELWKQNFSNGAGVVDTIFVNPKALRLRHLVPAFFVCAFIVLGFLAIFLSVVKTLLLGFWGLYIFLSILFSFIVGIKEKNIRAVFLPFVFLVLHLSYGFGSLLRLLSRQLKQKVI